MNNVTMKPVASGLVNSMLERAGLNENRVNNTARWEDLQTLKESIQRAVVEYAQAMNVSVQQLKNYTFSSSKEVGAVVNQFNTDLQGYVDDIELIARMHDGKSGLISGAEDNDIYFNAWERYSTLSTSFSTIFTNSMLTVTEALVEIQQQEAAAKAAEATQETQDTQNTMVS